MQPAIDKQPVSGAERAKRFRVRCKAIGTPTDAQFDRVLRVVVFEHIALPAVKPGDLVSVARDRLLKQGFSWQGVMRVVQKHAGAE